MHKVVILHAARQDISEAAQWYNRKQSGLGRRFISRVRSKVRFIQIDPLVFAVRYGTIRTAVLDVFPFMIHYAFRVKDNLVVVLAVLHTSRNPEAWQRRNL